MIKSITLCEIKVLKFGSGCHTYLTMSNERWNGWKFSFNPHTYKARLSALGSEVIDFSIRSWIENETTNSYQRQQTVFQLNSGDNNNYNNDANIDDSFENNSFNKYKQSDKRTPRNCRGNKQTQNNIFHFDVPFAGELLESKAVPGIIGDSKSSTKMKLEPQKEMVIEEFIPPTRQSILCPAFKTNIEKDVSQENPKGYVVEWDNMFDSNALFAIENNFDMRHSSIVKKTANKSKPTKPKAPLNVACKTENTKSPFRIEVSKEPGPKKNFKQKKITELIQKKKKVRENNKTDKTIEKVTSNSMRKKPYTKAVKDWLENVHPENSVDESTGMDVDQVELKTNVNVSNNVKKAIQSRLVNKGGVLKYSYKVDANKFIIHTKEGISQDVGVKPMSSHNKTTQEEVKNINIIAVELIKPRQIVCTDVSPSDNFEINMKNVYSGGAKIKLNGDKPKKKTSKFTAPIKSQIPIKDIIFEIVHLSEHNIGEHSHTLFQENNDDIIVTLIFQNEFNQLNRQYTEENCFPNGLMMCLDHTFYNLTKAAILESNSMKEFFKTFMSSERSKVCYDGKEIIMFAAECLDLHPSEIANGILDTKVACFLLDPDRPPNSFSDVQKAISFTPEYTLATDSNDQKTAWYMTLLNDCMAILITVLNENSLWNIFVDMEMKLLPIIAGLEMVGLQVDTVGLDNMKTTILEKMKQVEQKCYRSAGKSFQINSPLQLRTILYDDLRLDTRSNVKIKGTLCSGAKSTSEAMLKSLADVHPLPKLVLEYRHLHKALATFVTGIAQHVRDNVVRATWLQATAATGRIACNNPNLQAIPKLPFELDLYPKDIGGEQKYLQLRSVYVARPGRVFLAADFQHVECRVFAHLARDTTLVELFTRSGDFFVALAAKWLQKSTEEISREDREKTKRIVYASMYGAGTRKLMDILNISYDQALIVVSSFNRTFPSLKLFGERVVERCRQQGGVLETLCGRRRKFSNINSADYSLKSQAERQAVNFVIQGSAADLCKMAMISSARCLRELTPPADCQLVLQIHDELVWEVAEGHLERVRETVTAAMECCGRVCGMDVPLPVAACCGRSWADMQ